MEYEMLVCTHCLAVNRAARDHFSNSPLCASCGATLLPERPVDADLELFQHLIVESSLPVVADFWGAWSTDSHAMVSAFITMTQTFKGDAVFIKINSESEQVLAGRYDLQDIPTFILFKEGKEYHRLSGELTEQEFKAWLERYLRVKREIVSFNPNLVL
ncbi:thioredoxin domain-containing protein [Psychromonas ossibalaenae]|uniref:thioredoxin domain-containing protein n=1 Tax=Psychromonas ossibalaenae TaxID=444922 RepID=UPI0003661902|nr:thioredoxin domain-containing protein [Psychromonas ossibalaenae]